jgi:hypothetical protein
MYLQVDVTRFKTQVGEVFEGSQYRYFVVEYNMSKSPMNLRLKKDIN